jgi:hypothetical protein
VRRRLLKRVVARRLSAYSEVLEEGQEWVWGPIAAGFGVDGLVRSIACCLWLMSRRRLAIHSSFSGKRAGKNDHNRSPYDEYSNVQGLSHQHDLTIRSA